MDHTISGNECEVLTIAFSMTGEVYSRVGNSLPVETRKSTIEVFAGYDILKRCRLKIANLQFIFHCRSSEKLWTSWHLSAFCWRIILLPGNFFCLSEPCLKLV